MINTVMTEEKSYSSQKNQQIAETYAATMLRRSSQTVVQVDLKVKYGKKNNMPQNQIDFFYNVLIEAKRFKNYILNQTKKESDEYSDDDYVITDEHAKFLETLQRISEDVAAETAAEEEHDVLDIFKADQKDYKSVWYYTKGLNNPDTEYAEHKLVFLKSYAKADILNKMRSDIRELHTKKMKG